MHKSALILIRHEVEEWNGNPWTVHVLPELLMDTLTRGVGGGGNPWTVHVLPELLMDTLTRGGRGRW